MNTIWSLSPNTKCQRGYILNMLRIRLVICKPPWDTEQFKFPFFTHGTILPRQSPFKWLIFIL